MLISIYIAISVYCNTFQGTLLSYSFNNKLIMKNINNIYWVHKYCVSDTNVEVYSCSVLIPVLQLPCEVGVTIVPIL